MDDHQTPHQNDRIAQLSNAQLEFLARQELNKSEEIDVQLLQNIGKELDARDPAGAADAKAAWEDFKAHYLGTAPLYPMDTSEEQDATLIVAVEQTKVFAPRRRPASRPRKRRSVFRVAVVAAILCGMIVGISMTATATGVNIFDAVATWNDDLFSFLYPSAGNTAPGSMERTGEFWELTDTHEYGIDAIPE